MNTAPASNPKVPSRNGPMRWASRPPTEPNRMSGTANTVMPRLATKSLASRSSSTSDHRESNVPIIRNTRDADHDRGHERPEAEEIEGEPGGGVSPTSRFGHRHPGHQREADHGRQRDDQERRRDPERPDQHRRDRRAEREPTDVGGEEPAQVVPEPVAVR